MKLRLAGGVVASGRCAWVSRPSGPAQLADESAAPPGAAVALGPADATGEQVEHAVAELDRLVAAGGVVPAGAGVDLGGGFRSARLDGADGDQRDAVLAALKVLGIEGADRLGDRAGFLVALFGPSVTKRVGAATAQAIAEGRWAAVHLASAASDVLGPEQLERVLALRAPDGADLISGGLPSALATRLQQVFEPIPRQRRLELLADLWARVSDHHAELARGARLLASQARRSRVDEIRARRAHYEEELILARLRHDFDREPTLTDAARWEAPDHYWYGVLHRLLQDALAATALLRTAVAVSEHGMAAGLTRAEPMLAAVTEQVPDWAAAHAARPVPGLAGLPARPVSYVRDIHRRLGKGQYDTKLAGYVRPRLSRARDYALLTMEKIKELLDYALQPPDEVLHGWAGGNLTGWRRKVGYTAVRPPAGWAEVPPWTRRMLGLPETLADRLAAAPDQDPVEVEVVGDLLWYAELIDSLAQLYGHDAAKVTGEGIHGLHYDPPAVAGPLTPRLDSITLAVSGAAQLVELGAKPAKGIKTWAALIEDLRGDVDIAAALSGEFSIPAPLAAVDGTVVPGTGARFQLARSARTLAEWSDYMGNCIAGPYYIEDATKGRCALAALYDKDDHLLANIELRPARPAERGWRVVEIEGRFNENPDVALENKFRRWVTTIPALKPVTAEPPPDEPAWPDRPRRRRPRPRLLEDAGPALGGLAEQAWADQVSDDTIGTLAVVADTTPDAALTQLRRRLRAGPLTNACRDALGTGPIDLVDLWTATGVRPLAAAVEALDPALRERFERLDLLLGDNPLPGSMRKLVRLPAIAPAYSLDLVARRIRAAIGLLACDDDPVIAASVIRRTTRPLLCALVVAVTCRAPKINLIQVAPPRKVIMPGFPASSLYDPDGPWQRAFPAARELGADTGSFWDMITEHGLRAPASWLTAGGWTALWSKSR